MDAITNNMPLIIFLLVGTVAVASSILVVAMRNPVHSALFLLLTFLSVAVLFVVKGAEFVGAVQVLVYAGGVMVLFLFVVMLINVRNLGSEKLLAKAWIGGIIVGAAIFGMLAAVASSNAFHPVVNDPAAMNSVTVAGTQTREVVGNSEAIGMSLYTKYLVPFEIVSIYLLVAMVGAILIGKRELSAAEEEPQPQYILDRVRAEKDMKEAMSA